jgi:hypothetical protein
VPSFEFIKNHQPQLFPKPEGKKLVFTKELPMNWLFYGQLCDFVSTKNHNNNNNNNNNRTVVTYVPKNWVLDLLFINHGYQIS